MSGRPATASYSVPTWDTGNYAAGANPWNGQAKRVSPGATFFTPGNLDAAQYNNYVVGQGYDAIGNVDTAQRSILAMAGQLPALNWKNTVVVDGTKALQRGVFAVKDQLWIGVGNAGADYAMFSADYGQAWTAIATATGGALQDVAADAAGDLVFVTLATRSVVVGTRTAYATWTLATTSNAISVAPSSGASITYDPTHNKFIVMLRNGASGMVANNSTTLTSYTNQALPASWTGYTGTANQPLVASRAGGTTIGTFYDDVGVLMRFVQSTDGGTTWTDVGDIAPGFTPSGTYGFTRPVYDDVNGVWYVALWQQSGTRKTQLFYSTNDGASWTGLTSWAANDFCAQGLSSLGSLLVACNDDGRIAYSTASGASVAFQWAGKCVATATPITMTAGGGGLAVFWPSTRSVSVSQRFDNLGQSI